MQDKLNRKDQQIKCQFGNLTISVLLNKPLLQLLEMFSEKKQVRTNNHNVKCLEIYIFKDSKGAAKISYHKTKIIKTEPANEK